MRITRIGPFSLAKVAFILYGGIGLIIGCMVALASLLGATLGATEGEHGAFIGTIFGVGAVILFPLFYGVFGAIGALICAALYNVVAGIVGGVELTMEPAAGQR